MGVCETLMPDVVALEVHQNELSGPTFNLLRVCTKIKHGECLHGGPQKNTKLSKLGGARGCLGQ